MIVELVNQETGMQDPTKTTIQAEGQRPERRWSPTRLAAVVEAAYILEALGR
jgi:hypothetical protein